MSRKYVGKRNNPNFVYPNYNLNEYQTDIVHDLNDNSVYGSVSSISATSISSTAITFSIVYSWTLNGAEPSVLENGNYSFLSVHLMVPNQKYFRPWRLASNVSGVAASTKSGTVTFTVTPSQMGVVNFINGDYQFDIRMIGKRAIYPIASTYTISTIVQPTPTPTPTPSITPSNQTPTPTPTPSPTPINSQSGATLNVTDPGWIKFTNFSGNTEYKFVSSTGTYTLTNCAVCSTILPGFPFADIAVFTVTDCGTSCGASPVPSPTPTPSGGNFNYYAMDIFSCQPCIDLGYQVIGRTTATLTTGLWYTNGDGNAYYITGTVSGPSYDVNMTGAVSGPSCDYVCTI